jgi:hypothetical protein
MEILKGIVGFISLVYMIIFGITGDIKYGIWAIIAILMYNF